MCTIILVYLCIRKCHKEYFNFYSLHHYCEIILEFSSANHSGFVSILKLPGLPSDYTIQQTAFVSDINIIKSLRPKIMLNWETLKIINNLTLVDFAAPKFVHISILQSFMISRILSQNHICQSYFLFNKQRTPFGPSPEFPIIPMVNSVTNFTQTD